MTEERARPEPGPEFLAELERKLSEWQKMGEHLGGATYITNVESNYPFLASYPRKAIWSILDNQLLATGEAPKGYCDIAQIGVNLHAKYFLVYEHTWPDNSDKVVLSYRLTRSARGLRFPVSPESAVGEPLIRGHHQSVFAWQFLADPRTPVNTLVHCCHSGNEYDRALVATNPSCPENLIAAFARDGSEFVRAAVASRANRGIEKFQIEELCADESALVRSWMARHDAKLVGEEQQMRFAEDSAPEVRENLAGNSSSSSRVLRRVLECSSGAESRGVREKLASRTEIDINADLQAVTRNLQDVFPGMIHRLLTRADLNTNTIARLRERVTTRLFQTRLDEYERNGPSPATFPDSLIG